MTQIISPITPTFGLTTFAQDYDLGQTPLPGMIANLPPGMVNQGFSQHYICMKNDSDTGLRVIFKPSGNSSYLAPKEHSDIPVDPQDAIISFSYRWNNSVQSDATQQVFMMIITPYDIQKGYKIVQGGTVNPPSAAAAGLLPGLLPVGVHLSRIQSDPQVAGVDANFLIVSDGAGNLTFHLISGVEGAIFFDLPGVGNFANMIGFGTNDFFGMFETDATHIQAQFGASGGMVFKNTDASGANEQLVVKTGQCWLAATDIHFYNALRTYGALAHDDGTVVYLKAGYFVETTSASSASLVNGSTITTAHVGVARVTESAAVTGIIMQAGTVDGQECWVVNQGGFSITMAASGTSNVADGVSCIIAASGGAKLFVWNNATLLWYHA